MNATAALNRHMHSRGTFLDAAGRERMSATFVRGYTDAENGRERGSMGTYGAGVKAFQVDRDNRIYMERAPAAAGRIEAYINRMDEALPLHLRRR